MLHYHLPDLSPVDLLAVIAADRSRQLIAVAPHLHKPGIDRDPHARLDKGAGIGHMVEPAHFGGEETLRRDDLQRRARAGDQFRRLHARMAAIVVEQQNVRSDRNIARQDIP